MKTSLKTLDFHVPYICPFTQLASLSSTSKPRAFKKCTVKHIEEKHMKHSQLASKSMEAKAVCLLFFSRLRLSRVLEEVSRSRGERRQGGGDVSDQRPPFGSLVWRSQQTSQKDYSSSVASHSQSTCLLKNYNQTHLKTIKNPLNNSKTTKNYEQNTQNHRTTHEIRLTSTKT